MSRKGRVIKVNKLNSAVQKALEEYGQFVSEGVADKALGEAAQWGVEQLRSSSPRRKKNGGAYAASWDCEKEYTKKTKVGWVIFSNAPHYRLTSWLEKGHATRNGGRTKAQPHIGVVEANIGDEVVKRIKEALK